MDGPLPLVEASATLDEAFALLSGGVNALVAVRGERPGRCRDQARHPRVPGAPQPTTLNSDDQPFSNSQ